MTLTAGGYKRKRYDEYLADLENEARQLYGADVNLSDKSPLGQWCKLLAYRFSISDEEKEDLYNSDYVDFATGVSLDYCVKRIGISRFSEEYATNYVTVDADSGTTVMTGLIFATTDGVEFTTVTSAAEVNGEARVTVRCNEPGPIGNVPPNTITQIVTPTAGVNAVTNPEAFTNGRSRETDAELRERYYRSLSLGGGASTPSVEAALLQTAGVIDAIVDENEMDFVVNGLPPNCIAPLVYGGDDKEIASVIFAQKSGGIRSYGTTVIDITDSRGKVHKVGFSRPNEIAVNVRITATTNSNFPIDGDTQIINAVVSYIGGVDSNNVAHDGQGLNIDIVPFKTAAAFSSIPGIDDAVIEFSTDNGQSWTTDKITVSGNSIAKTDYTKVAVIH